MSLRSVTYQVALPLLSLALTAAQCAAAAPRFPWHGHAAAHAQPAVGQVPAQVLTQPATTPTEPLPPKQAYSYGWFGSNPTYHWKRSFGVSRGYTQWSRY